MSRPPLIVTTPQEVMDATLGAVTVGLVPVMGTLHEGHLALIRRSDAENDDTVVCLADPSGVQVEVMTTSIADASKTGAHIFYIPEVETVFPPGFATSVHVEGLTSRWEGESRPGYFDRVSTLIAILLSQLQPTRIYVGEKHLQHVAVLRRMHTDLSLSGEIVPCPTVRDPDGLPLSSYNTALSPEDREAALAIPNALFAMQHQALEAGADIATLEANARAMIAEQPRVVLDYLAIVDPGTFEPLTELLTGARAIVAGTVGETRILDNIYLQTSVPESPEA